MSDNNTCKTCRFKRDALDHKRVIMAAFYGISDKPHMQSFCHLHPVPIRVDDRHWCGQHKTLDTASGPA